MIAHIRKVAFIALPILAAGVLLGLFGRPKDAETVVVEINIPDGVEILHTTGFNCKNDLPLEDFNQNYSTETAIVAQNRTGNFKVFAVSNDSVNSCVKSELVSVSPTVYGQAVEGYEIDEDNELLIIEVGSGWRNTDGVDSAGMLNPSAIMTITVVLSVLWAALTWSVQYTKFWHSPY